MAEAAAMALWSTRIVSTLGIQCPFILTDNQLLVNFFNGEDHNNPPQSLSCSASSITLQVTMQEFLRYIGSLKQQHIS
jgi:hypothetical protein